jgi:hypothetical protein
MKKLVQKTRGLIRGAPTAMVLSALIHLLLLVVAGGVVIFSVVRKQEKKFVPPPPVERPKMQLRKPRVKVRKSVRPKSTQRILSHSTVQGVPEIQLPEVPSMTKGLFGGIEGFVMIPDSSELTMFGGRMSTALGNDLEGTFYALGLDRHGRKNNMSTEQNIAALRQFIDSGWNPNALARYYRSSRKLYATQIFIPPVSSAYGPEQFGMGFGQDFDPIHWCIHYKGKIARKDGGRFRFAGLGDEVLMVRLNKKIVMNAGWGGAPRTFQTVSAYRNPIDEDNLKYFLGHGKMAFGEWFELQPGEPADIEVLIGEIPGGLFTAMLLIQQDGEEYPTKQDGGPILPIFRTAEIPEKVKEQIQYTLIEGEADLYNDLMFNVY